jgi:hypothetical protein
MVTIQIVCSPATVAVPVEFGEGVLVRSSKGG